MNKLTIGRFGADMLSGEVASVDSTGKKWSFSGRTAYASRDDAVALRQQLLGYVDSPDESFVPVTWGEDPSVDGYYRVTGASVGAVAGLADQGVVSFSVDLERVQGFAAPLIESVLMGKLRNSTLGISGSRALGIPASARSFAPWRPSLGYIAAAPDVIRQGSTSDVAVFQLTGPDDRIISQYYLPPARFYDAAATLEVGSTLRVAVGRQIPNLPDAWRLSNDLFQIRGIPGSTFAMQFRMWNVSSWSPWQSLTIWGGNSGGTPLAHLAAPHTITVLSNSPEAVTIRLLTTTPGAYAPVMVDLTLRRGSRFVAVELHSIFVSEFTAFISDFGTWATLTGGKSGTNAGIVTFAGSALATAFTAGTETAMVSNEASVKLVTHFPFCVGLTNSTESAQAMLWEYFWAGTDKQSVVAR